MARVSLRLDSSHPASTLFDELRDAVKAPDPARLGRLPVCGNGVLLRALLLAHGTLAVVLLHTADGLAGWLNALALLSMVATPATLAWLLACCSLRQPLARQSRATQGAAVLALGGAAAWLAWAPLAWVGLAPGTGSGWAVMVTGMALAGLVHQWERWRARARLPAAAAARLADLQTRIRPHFLFNTLNTAIALVQHDPQRAEQVLEDLSELFRAALVGLDEATTLASEIELSQRYLAIESLRFGERLQVQWALDPNASQARLPVLALQPLIENAVRHGVECDPEGGVIEVRTLRRRDRVLVSVTNTVPAAAASRPGHGLGMASVRERLRLMHDLDADFRSGIIEDGRWRVSLSVPA